MKQKTFLLGVGCQKGGTTWFCSQLRKNPAINMGIFKEYHVLQWHGKSDTKLAHRRERLEQQLSQDSTLDDLERKRLRYRISFWQNIDNYFNYFTELYDQSDQTEIVGDMTPAYFQLSPESLTYAKAQLEARGFAVKVVFVMRDPFERVWSQVRMIRKREHRLDPDLAIIETEQEDLLAFYKHRKYEFRSDYERTVRNIESVFERDAIFYGFFERLFTQRTMDSFFEFLNVVPTVADVDKPVGASPKRQSIERPVIEEIVNHHRATYSFCESRFGTSEIWQGYQYL